MKSWLLSLALLTGPQLFAEEIAPEKEFVINLKDPVFSQGVISTEKGGVISSENIRIQAQKITYTNRIENGITVKKVYAEGDLLLEFGDRPFVGEKLEYDFVTKKGKLWKGRTSTEYWFVGGDEIDIQPDGSFYITNAFLTTVEGQDAWWELKSSHIDVTQKNLLAAKNIKFKFFKIPIFWLPSFKMNLDWAKAPIRYKFIWDQILKQKISMRYEVYSTENFSLFGRFDYRFKYGPGAAIETDYLSPDERSIFQTKSYGAYDKSIPQERGTKRYRLQGLYTTHSRNDRTHVHASYDWMTDNKMPQDFKSDDFELNTQQRTIFWVSHQHDNFFTRFNLQPRINRFQSINQELPYIVGTLRPLTLGQTGIISDNWFGLGYLDYVYSTGLSDRIPAKKAGRFETNNFLYRPLSTGPVTVTPSAGLIGIFYTNNPDHHSTAQAIFAYGVKGETELSHRYSSMRHSIIPYASYQGYTRPTSNLDEHFYFNLDDAFAHYSYIRTGLRQNFYTIRKTSYLPNISWDLYTYGFFGKTAFHRTFPKAYTSLELLRPSIAIRAGIAYNMQEELFDYANLRTDWTASQDFAIGIEYRHRSRFYWRKANQENYVIDIERPIEELLHSTLSDARNTFLTRFQLRISPLWNCHFESHHGWGRRNEPNYNEFNMKVTTLVTGRWLVEFGLSYDPAKKWQGIMPTFKLSN